MALLGGGERGVFSLHGSFLALSVCLFLASSLFFFFFFYLSHFVFPFFLCLFLSHSLPHAIPPLFFFLLLFISFSPAHSSFHIYQ